MDSDNSALTESSQKTYSVELQHGKIYVLCTCDRSKRMPFCDGSHGSSGLKPTIFKSNKSATYLICSGKACEENSNLAW